MILYFIYSFHSLRVVSVVVMFFMCLFTSVSVYLCLDCAMCPYHTYLNK